MRLDGPRPATPPTNSENVVALHRRRLAHANASVPRVAHRLTTAATPEGALRDPAQLLSLVKILAEENLHLQTALDSRIVIEQAKGVLAERLGVGVDEAFSVLRRAARNHRVKLHSLAAAVVASRTTPDEIASLTRGTPGEGERVSLRTKQKPEPGAAAPA